MNKTVIALVGLLAIAGCTTAEQAGTVGAVGGGVIGLAASGGDPVAGLAGAAIGGAGGYVLGRIADRPGYCTYVDRRTGREYVDRC